MMLTFVPLENLALDARHAEVLRCRCDVLRFASQGSGPCQLHQHIICFPVHGQLPLAATGFTTCCSCRATRQNRCRTQNCRGLWQGP